MKFGETPQIVKESERAGRQEEVNVSNQELGELKEYMLEGTLVGASDGSVMGDKKAILVWMGDKETGEGVMISEGVPGYPHDSGRAELAGPIVALRTLRRIEERYGVVGNVVMWTDSMETLRVYKKGKVKKLPSRSCARNVDLKLQLEELKEAYGGVLEMRKVKAHQDERKRYEDMEFEERMNKECDEAAKAKAREVVEGWEKGRGGKLQAVDV